MSVTCACTQPILLSVLCIVTVYPFFLHGMVKFFGFSVVMGDDSPGGLMLMVGILGIVSGTLPIFGLFTCPTAFILSGQMAVAYFAMHATKDSTLSSLANGDGSAVLFCLVFLYLAATGGGSLALDNLFGRNKIWYAQGSPKNKQSGFGEFISKPANRLDFN